MSTEAGKEERKGEREGGGGKEGGMEGEAECAWTPPRAAIERTKLVLRDRSTTSGSV